MEDGYMYQELFSLTFIKGKKDLVVVENNEYEDDIDEVRNSESEESHDKAEGYTSSDVDSEEDRKRYDQHVDELLDEAYERFIAKKEGSTKQRKMSKQAYSNDDQLLKGDDSMIHSDQDSENEKNEREANPLLLPPKEYAPAQEEIASQWFSQDVFMDANEHEELEKDDSEDEIPIDKPIEHHRVPVKKTVDLFEEPIGQKKSRSQMTQSSKVEDGFEIVPAPETDSSDSSSESYSDDDSIDTKAELLACAKKMLTKKQREVMLDDGRSLKKSMHVLLRWQKPKPERNGHPLDS